MEEQENIIDQTAEKKSFPVFLMILLILTSANILWQIYGSFESLGAENTIQEIQQELYQNLEDSGTDIESLPPQILSAFEDFFPRFANNYGKFAWFELGIYLLLAVAVFLMFKRKLSGFWLYVVLQIVMALGFVIFFGTNWITISVTIALFLWNGLWIFLYSLNRKKLSW